MNENNNENIEEDETAEQAAAESAVEEIDGNAAIDAEDEGTAEEIINNDTIIEPVSESPAEEVAKSKSKMLIAYICGFVIFMAAAVTALVCFGLYAYNLVHDEEVSAENYSVEYIAANL